MWLERCNSGCAACSHVRNIKTSPLPFYADILATRAAINKSSQDLKSSRNSAQNSFFRFSLTSAVARIASLDPILPRSHSSFLIALLSLVTKPLDPTRIEHILSGRNIGGGLDKGRGYRTRLSWPYYRWAWPHRLFLGCFDSSNAGDHGHLVLWSC